LELFVNCIHQIYNTNTPLKPEIFGKLCLHKVAQEGNTCAFEHCIKLRSSVGDIFVAATKEQKHAIKNVPQFKNAMTFKLDTTSHFLRSRSDYVKS
jgi:hypothetical protein